MEPQGLGFVYFTFSFSFSMIFLFNLLLPLPFPSSSFPLSPLLSSPSSLPFLSYFIPLLHSSFSFPFPSSPLLSLLLFPIPPLTHTHTHTRDVTQNSCYSSSGEEHAAMEVDTIRLPSLSSQTSTLDDPSVQQLLMEACSRIGEPDSLYGACATRSFDETTRVRMYEHEGQWERSLREWSMIYWLMTSL